MQSIFFPPIDVKIEGMERVRIPRMARIRQLFDASCIENVQTVLRAELEQKTVGCENLAGKRVAVTVGSRGIPHLEKIVRTTVDWLKERGAQPFLVPAMGSHGNATAEGQLEIVKSYGITEESMGVPILSSMDVVWLGSLDDGTPIYCDRCAAEADGLVLLNKIKPHTDFKGTHESGLAKMMAIGLGNHKGASMFHMMGMDTFPERLPKVAEIFLKTLPVLFGIGVVQNAYDHLCVVEVVPAAGLLEREAELLEIAKSRMGKFKFDDIDVLIVDEIGKNISGAGLDPNIVGRNFSRNLNGVLRLKKLFIRGLTEETHHIGIGISLADITTRRCLNSIDFSAVWANAVTATVIQAGAIPMYTENDRDALLLAIRTCNGIDFDRARVVRIKNTLELTEFEVSEALLDELRGRSDIQILCEPQEMRFDTDGFFMESAEIEN